MGGPEGRMTGLILGGAEVESQTESGVHGKGEKTLPGGFGNRAEAAFDATLLSHEPFRYH